MTENTTASGAADDTLLICASDLQHSAIYDNPHEMVDCVRAVADRITALAASAPVAPAPQPPAGLLSVGVRVKVLPSATKHNQKPMVGKIGTIHRLCSDLNWDVCFTGEDGNWDRFVAFDPSELEVCQDAEVAAAPKAAPAINKVSDIIDAYGMKPGQPERVADIPGLAEALEAAFADGSAQITGAAPLQQGEYLPLAVASAPERIWLDLGFDPKETDADFSDLNTPTWSADNASGHGIEYVRADLAQDDSDLLTIAYMSGMHTGKRDAARGAAQEAPAPVAEDAEIRKALHDAATSLETISRIAGKDPYMLEMVDVRIYAAARAKVARDAQAAQPEGGAND